MLATAAPPRVSDWYVTTRNGRILVRGLRGVSPADARVTAQRAVNRAGCTAFLVDAVSGIEAMMWPDPR